MRFTCITCRAVYLLPSGLSEDEQRQAAWRYHTDDYGSDHAPVWEASSPGTAISALPLSQRWLPEECDAVAQLYTIAARAVNTANRQVLREAWQQVDEHVRAVLDIEFQYGDN